eukprot:14715687-Ditylum_brightwellii.AAC.1
MQIQQMYTPKEKLVIDQHIFQIPLQDWASRSLTQMHQWIQNCQPVIAHCLKKYMLQQIYKIKDIQTYFPSEKPKRLPKTLKNDKSPPTAKHQNKGKNKCASMQIT